MVTPCLDKSEKQNDLPSFDNIWCKILKGTFEISHKIFNP